MKITVLFLFIALSLGATTTGAMAANSAKATPTSTPEATPSSTPKPKKPTFFDRVFGRLPTPTPSFALPPTPAPSATPRKKRVKAAVTPTPETTPPTETIREATPPASTPAPTPRVKKSVAKATPAPQATPDSSPSASADATPLPNSLPPLDAGSKESETPAETEPQPTASAPPAPLPAETPQVSIATEVPSETPPVSEVVRANPLNQPIPIIGDVAAPPQNTPDTTSEDSERQKLQVANQLQYKKLRAQALKDEKLQALQQKADLAGSIVERYAALKAYYPALFTKMRKLDPSQSDLIDQMEAASQRRLERLLVDNPEIKPGK